MERKLMQPPCEMRTYALLPRRLGSSPTNLWWVEMATQPSAARLRVVSLLPSCTDIVHGLGLTDMLVGRSHEVRSPCARPACDAACGWTPSAVV